MTAPCVPLSTALIFFFSLFLSFVRSLWTSMSPIFVLHSTFLPNFVHPIFLVFWNFCRLLLYMKTTLQFAPIFWHRQFWFLAANLIFRFQIVFCLRPCFLFDSLVLFLWVMLPLTFFYRLVPMQQVLVSSLVGYCTVSECTVRIPQAQIQDWSANTNW